MVDVALLIIILLIGKQCSKLSLSSKTYYAVTIGTYITLTFLVLLTLKLESVSSFVNQLCEPLVEIGLGNPKAWRMRTREFDDQIVACYYLNIFGMIFVTLVGAAYEHKKMPSYNKNDLFNKVLLLGFLYLVILYLFFYMETRLSGSLWAVKSMKVMFNSIGGMMFFSFLMLHMANQLSPAFRATYRAG